MFAPNLWELLSTWSIWKYPMRSYGNRVWREIRKPSVSFIADFTHCISPVVYLHNIAQYKKNTIFFFWFVKLFRSSLFFQFGKVFHSIVPAVAAHFQRRLKRSTNGGAVRVTENSATHIFIKIYTRYSRRFPCRHPRYGRSYRGRNTARSAKFSAFKFHFQLHKIKNQSTSDTDIDWFLIQSR